MKPLFLLLLALVGCSDAATTTAPGNTNDTPTPPKYNGICATHGGIQTILLDDAMALEYVRCVDGTTILADDNTGLTPT